METKSAQSGQALRRLFLARLERCARLAATVEPSTPPGYRVLARRATLSTYRDCLALGAEVEARDILGRALRDRSAA